MLSPKLIYCDGQNKKYASIAISSGFLYGARLPSYALLDQKLYFCDVDWKTPNETLYLNDVLQHKPALSTVIDIQDLDTLSLAIKWSNILIDSVDHIIFIPKIDIIDSLPKYINGKEVLLGYSVPSTYGKTDISITKFLNYRIHLLGGSPHTQMRLFQKYPQNIFSVDGNYATKMANKYKRYWVRGCNDEITNRFWVRDALSENSEIFKTSCENIYTAWNTLFSTDSNWLKDRRQG